MTRRKKLMYIWAVGGIELAAAAHRASAEFHVLSEACVATDTAMGSCAEAAARVAAGRVAGATAAAAAAAHRIGTVWPAAAGPVWRPVRPSSGLSPRFWHRRPLVRNPLPPDLQRPPIVDHSSSEPRRRGIACSAVTVGRSLEPHLLQVSGPPPQLRLLPVSLSLQICSAPRVSHSQPTPPALRREPCRSGCSGLESAGAALAARTASPADPESGVRSAARANRWKR
mmetsp:Transcript_61924/g.164575  ORF Transcript_61924/g.164575 Transcript_61924/m.164575 type:complete len:227 (-) Transcript_61924:1106-1786(-)